MDNYHYIIAGLPDLVLSADNKSFSYDMLREAVYLSSAPKDRRLIEWLEFGSKEENLNPHFYRAALQCKNPFIRAYFALDLEIRNRKVDFIQQKENTRAADSGQYKILPENYIPLEFTPEEADQLKKVFGTENILEKEQLLDKFKWDFLSAFNPYGIFNMNLILAFLAKGKLIDRWNKLDKKTGQEMFKRLVDEVRGTFTGIKI